MKSKSKFKKGDLIAIGWNGKMKLPFPAIITKVHPSLSPDEDDCYTIYIFDACRTNFITGRDLKKFEDYLNK